MSKKLANFYLPLDSNRWCMCEIDWLSYRLATSCVSQFSWPGSADLRGSLGPDHTKLLVRFQLQNCWKLCTKTNVDPPLFTLSQPEMPTDDVKNGRCNQLSYASHTEGSNQTLANLADAPPRRMDRIQPANHEALKRCPYNPCWAAGWTAHSPGGHTGRAGPGCGHYITLAEARTTKCSRILNKVLVMGGVLVFAPSLDLPQSI